MLKSLRFIILLTLCPLFLSGCMLLFPAIGDTSSDRTHSEYMDLFETKGQVLSVFGPPTSKDFADGNEYWSYNLGTVQNSYAGATGNAYNSYNGVRANASAYGTSSSYNKTVRFTIRGDRVTYWTTKGVNYEDRSAYWNLFLWGYIVDMGVLLAAFLPYL